MSIEIRYTLTMPQPETHRFHVRVEVDAWQLAQAELVLPAWTPGSYLIREFARHIEHFRAETLAGTPLPWQRVNKAMWQIETNNVNGFRIQYEVYANELTVRTSHLDSTHGYFNGTNLFMYVDGFKQHPVTLAIEEPPGWHTSIALPQNEQGHYEAVTYDILADSPGEIGTHRVLHFEALGKPHEVALWGHGNENESVLVQDLKRVVEYVAKMFCNQLPYERYLFIVHLGDQIRGGLEHRDSTTLAVDRWTFFPSREYEKFVRLAIHEFFHTWNVKRIRPSNLGPFDYTQEAYTPLLWVMEGFTSYYDYLIQCRSGFISPKRYLQVLQERIATYLKQPGRLIQSLEESSLTTWIKFYRKDENYINSGISYYLKGSFVALMLDFHLRIESGNEKTLDDVMRYLWHLYGTRDVGFSEDEFYDAVEGVGEIDIDPFLERFVRGVEELPLAEYFAFVGLELTSGHKSDTPKAWLGLNLQSKSEEIVIKNVLRDSPAEIAGLMAKDRLIAIDGYEIRDKTFLNARLREKAPDDKASFHLLRNGLLLKKEVTLTKTPPDYVSLRPQKDATMPQRKLLEAWLATSWENVAK